MAKKNRIVSVVTEDGQVDVYGPYTKGEADDVEEQIYRDDTSQKVRVDVNKLALYEGEYRG